MSQNTYMSLIQNTQKLYLQKKAVEITKNHFQGFFTLFSEVGQIWKSQIVHSTLRNLVHLKVELPSRNIMILGSSLFNAYMFWLDELD